MEQKYVSELPEAFTKKMRTLLGEEYDAFVQSYDKERVQGLRLNTLKGDLDTMLARHQAQFGLTPVAWCEEGFYYQQETRPGRHAYHEAGVYYIQEPSAMAVVSLLAPKPGEVVLDLCAAPGGKTTHIAERLAGEGLLISNEIHPARAKILAQNVERMGIANAVVTNEESGRLRSYFPELFDKIVVDAPCSGEGMFRKDEQARAEWSEENVQICVKRQQEILDNAAEMLKVGGRLVYSTCTFSPEEDEDGIAAFLERHPEFSIVTDVPLLEGLSKGRAEWSHRDCKDLAHTFRIWPHKVEGEGHYLALLEKTGEEAPKRKRKAPKFWADKIGKQLLCDFMKETVSEDAFAQMEQMADRCILFGEQIYALPQQMIAFDGLRVLRPGLHLGTLKKKRLEPSHALALALNKAQVQRSADYAGDSKEILAYLTGNTLPIDAKEKGWVLICVDGYSIGWAKAASGILKNHYPKGLRI